MTAESQYVALGRRQVIAMLNISEESLLVLIHVYKPDGRQIEAGMVSGQSTPPT